MARSFINSLVVTDVCSGWTSRKLDECRYAYIWADGVYLGAGVDREKTALLCVVGAREDGSRSKRSPEEEAWQSDSRSHL